MCVCVCVCVCVCGCGCVNSHRKSDGPETGESRLWGSQRGTCAEWVCLDEEPFLDTIMDVGRFDKKTTLELFFSPPLPVHTALGTVVYTVTAGLLGN